MKLENEFTVPAPLDQAWAVLLDVERVAPCLPGAQVEPGAGDDGEYAGTMTIKIGPITSRYKGTVKIEQADVDARVAVMRAQAKDARGQGTAAATITSRMEEVADGTRVRVETDMRVTGPAAQFGRGVMQDVSAKLMRQFADCLASEMSAAPEPRTVATPEPITAAPEPQPEPVSQPEPAAAPQPEPVAAAPEPEPLATPEPITATPEPEPPRERPTPDVLDLGEASKEALLKRALPIIGGLVAALILLRLIRR